nr:hypothetical protein [Tanacetum cinerariifolium]
MAWDCQAGCCGGRDSKPNGECFVAAEGGEVCCRLLAGNGARTMHNPGLEVCAGEVMKGRGGVVRRWWSGAEMGRSGAAESGRNSGTLKLPMLCEEDSATSCAGAHKGLVNSISGCLSCGLEPALKNSSYKGPNNRSNSCCDGTFASAEEETSCH